MCSTRQSHATLAASLVAASCSADAAYASPAIYARLEEAGYFYVIRLPANAVLREKIVHRLTRPVGRPSLTKVKRFFEDFHY